MDVQTYLKIRKEVLNKKPTIKENFVSVNIDENLLSELWYRQWFDRRNLKTIDGMSIIILSPGEYNTSCGPDFVNAKINVNGKLYYGDVEIHKKRSDWFIHKHSEKQEYKNVILHVFYELDTEKVIENKQLFEICLKNKINPDRIYTTDTLDKTFLAEDSFCGKMLLPKDYKYLENLLISAAEARLVLKSEKFYRLFTNKNVEEQILYEKICEVYGYANNKDNFLLLAKLVPINKLRKIVNLIAKEKSEIIEIIESIYFGVSGLIKNAETISRVQSNHYIEKILNLWDSLKNKFNTISFSRWKFYKTRPINYPYRRIAALSRTIANFIQFRITDILCNFIKYYEGEDIVKHITNIFYQPADGFFATRCSFTSKPFARSYPLFGEEKVGTVIVNVVFPYYIYYAKKYKNQSLYNKVMSVYKSLKFKEKNKIVEKFIQKIIRYPQYRKYFFSYSMFVQGFLQIYKDFCEPIRSCCDSCYLVKILSYRFEKDNDNFQYIQL